MLVTKDENMIPTPIHQARAAGLALLQPSRRDLAYGLGLHADSFVMDAYGFAPLTAPDPAALRRLAEAGASDIELQDAREEMSMLAPARSDRARREYETAWNQAGVHAIFQNAGEEGQSPLRLLKRLARFTHLTDRLGRVVARAATPDDLIAARLRRGHALYVSANGVPLAQDWKSAHDELAWIKLFFQLGCRMMHLTYNRRNMIGDGCAETADAGLSDFGRAVIAEMNRVGVIVDTAHSGWRTTLEAARASAVPVVASHSACADLHPHYRGKPDAVIKALADSGGYLGIACIPAFLGGRGDLNRFLDHVLHAVRLVGADHVAIGTDSAYMPADFRIKSRQAPSRPARPRWENFWRTDAAHPDDPAWNRPRQRLTLAWSNWPLFTVGLVQRGLKNKDIQKIIGGNVLRVAKAAWKARTDG